MKFIVRARRAGKTWDAMRMVLANPNAVLITFHQQRKDEIERVHGLKGAVPQRVYTLDEWRVASAGRVDQRTVVVMDDIDVMLQRIVGPHKIVAVTATGQLEDRTFNWVREQYARLEVPPNREIREGDTTGDTFRRV